MKNALRIAALATVAAAGLGGCAVVPVGEPGYGYYGVPAVYAAPAVVVRPAYRPYYRPYYRHHWR